ncbi:SAV_915 family protein [Kitasatospora camelliae]|uniref:SAV_915 family protein n=1 Tax=Kitasatospora camelliae TaxID=3156397 RepID=A0AAU8K2B2_9ACTN
MARDDSTSADSPCHTLWYVPVRRTGTAAVLRFFRRGDGRRCAVGFGSAEVLTALLGPAQASVTLTEPALRGLAEPLGVRLLVFDPALVAPQAAPAVPAAPPGSRGAVPRSRPAPPVRPVAVLRRPC